METRYKVLITTSGTGSRLKEMTKYLNKSLVRIGKKPAISYIIESYPKEVVLVITLGYLAEQMKEFLLMAYPDRKFEFVKVDKYEGEGSSLGFSMLHAKNNLQCPFIFHSCDTIVTENIPAPDKNWVVGYMYDKSSGELDANQYRTHKVVNGEVIRLNEKGDPDFESIHIGLIGVKDYEAFWDTLTQIYENDRINTGHSDVHVVDKMIKSGHKFDLVAFNYWYDTGNPAALEKTRRELGGDFKILDKLEESIYIFDKFVIKFFNNPQMVKNRVARAIVLAGLVPEIENSGKYFYRYKYVEGDLYARVANAADFKIFLSWANDGLWRKTNTVSRDQFKSTCLDFYKNKTLDRVKKFLAENNVIDSSNIINGESVPSVSEVIASIDFNRLSDAEQYLIHGDFILDNIIKTKNGYCLLDWRQDFGGLIEAGDMYYDFAKMNHNLTVNHDLINDNQFDVKVNGNKVEYSIETIPELQLCREQLRDFVESNGFDWQRVELLTGIIWLNMAPLHPVPANFNLLLFYLGKSTIWKMLKK